MDYSQVVEILYAEFGHDKFLTRHIPAEAMNRLARAMEIPDTGPSRKIKVGQALSNMGGRKYVLPSGKQVAMAVERPSNNSQPRVFSFVPVPEAKADDRITTVEIPDLGGTYQVILVESGYGYAAFCPALRGCVSQGLDESEALENITEAITGWLRAEARDIERRTRALVDEYRAAGFPVKIDIVSTGRIGN